MFAPLAQLTAPETSTSWEIDWPYTPGEWGLCLVFALLALASIWLYRKDSQNLPRGWPFILAALRVSALAGIAMILLNPHHRTQTTGFRPSEIAILVDTSTSMQQPVDDPKPGQTGPTRTETVRALLADSPLIQELRQQHVVNVFTFDADLRPQALRLDQLEKTTPGATPPAPEEPVNWTTLIEPQGSTTRLADSVDKLLAETRSRPLAGIVVFTDGASNSGREIRTANERAKAQGIPLYAVGLGGTQPPVNIALQRIVLPSDVQKGDPFDITALIQGINIGGKTATVELLEKTPEQSDAQVVDSTTVPLFDDGVLSEARFERRTTEAGPYEYTVRVKVPDLTETRDDDNQQSRTINVFDRPLKVLAIAGGPMREYVFARNVLHRNRSMQIDVWLQSGEPGISQDANQLVFKFPDTREDLFQYDAILAFDPDWSLITSEQQKWIEEWISNEGGGLMFVASDVNTPALAKATEDGSPIGLLLPVVLDQVQPVIGNRDRSAVAHQPGFTPEGKAAEFLQLADSVEDSIKAWNQFPGLYRCYPTRGRKGGATVYLEFSDPLTRGSDGQPVLLAGHRFGQGSVLYLGSPEFWRLRAEDEQYYERLWTKLTRKVTEGRSKRGVQRALVILEGREAELGQTIPVRVRAVNSQYQPLTSDTLRIEVIDPRGRPLVPAPILNRDRNRATEFAGHIRAALPGRYRLELTVPDSSETVSAELDVLVPQREFASLTQDVAALKSLTDGTGGGYFSPADVSRFPSMIPGAGEEFLIDQRIQELWDRGWVLWFLVGLLCVEWLCRKLLKLA